MWAELCVKRLEILKPYVEGRRVWDQDNTTSFQEVLIKTLEAAP